MEEIYGYYIDLMLVVADQRTEAAARLVECKCDYIKENLYIYTLEKGKKKYT